MSLLGTLTSGVSAMQTFSKGLEVIGNNIANVNTVGYKESRTTYSDSFSQSLAGAAGTGNSPAQIGTGVKIGQVNSIFDQGVISATGNTTDLAVVGNGFFRVENPVDGLQFATRAGDFKIDDQGYLVTSRGFRVQGLTGGTDSAAPSTLGDIRLSQNPPLDANGDPTELVSFSINAQGEMVEFYSNNESVVTNQILLQSYTDPSSLTKVGDNLYTGFDLAGPVGGTTLSAASGSPGSGGNGSIKSGSLELSNVDLTEEFANMITTQRSFQAGSRLVTVSDSVLEDIVNLKR